MRRAKRKAAADGRTLTNLIEGAIRQAVNEPPKTAAKGKRILPPVSKATGGLLPGVGPDIHGAIQEMEDQEYIERFLKNAPR